MFTFAGSVIVKDVVDISTEDLGAVLVQHFDRNDKVMLFIDPKAYIVKAESTSNSVVIQMQKKTNPSYLGRFNAKDLMAALVSAGVDIQLPNGDPHDFDLVYYKDFLALEISQVSSGYLNYALGVVCD